MKELLNNLNVGDKLYKTSKGTYYLFRKKSLDGGISYSINKAQKTLPLETINKAVNDKNLNNIEKRGVLRTWYKDYNPRELTNNPCNVSVLKNLILKRVPLKK